MQVLLWQLSMEPLLEEFDWLFNSAITLIVVEIKLVPKTKTENANLKLKKRTAVKIVLKWNKKIVPTLNRKIIPRLLLVVREKLKKKSNFQMRKRRLKLKLLSELK